ncbi:MAG: hypothetical protein IPI39_25500 [Candidatus Obscuribacter sp.]|nr:hypothetical protein [Candidatus Obscuribacter sp.]
MVFKLQCDLDCTRRWQVISLSPEIVANSFSRGILTALAIVSADAPGVRALLSWIHVWQIANGQLKITNQTKERDGNHDQVVMTAG